MSTTSANDERLRALMEDILLLEPDQYADETTPDDVESWDSLGMISLIVGLESEFGVSIPADDGQDLMSIGAIKSYLRNCGVEI